ncbi:MAG: hypothetical protein L0331_16260, partial [Chloroflexi bacterium]|nr:hypothetical protein [Chloroflexota bacterium]
HPGSITFSRPADLQESRFIFLEYSPLTLDFTADGLAAAAITSASGGPAPPTPTPEPDEAAYQALEQTLEQQAAALQAGDLEAYLATFDPAIHEAQQRHFEYTGRLPLANHTLLLDPSADLAAAASGRLAGAPVIARFELAGLAADNPFIYIAHYDFQQVDGRWLATAVAYEQPPFWLASDFILQETAHFLLFAPTGNDDALPSFGEEAESAYQTLEALGLVQEARYLAYLTATQEQFQSFTGSGDLALGVAFVRYGFEEDEVVTTNRIFFVNGEAFAGRAATGPNGRLETVTHELVHLALSAYTRPFTPSWLSEGAAVYYAGQLTAGRRTTLLDSGLLDSISLLALTRAGSLGGTETDSQRVEVEYTYAGELFTYLVETYGEETALAFYCSYAAVPASAVQEEMPPFSSGFGLDAAMIELSERLTRSAVEEFFGRTLEELENDFEAWLLGGQGYINRHLIGAGWRSWRPQMRTAG